MRQGLTAGLAAWVSMCLAHDRTILGVLVMCGKLDRLSRRGVETTWY